MSEKTPSPPAPRDEAPGAPRTMETKLREAMADLFHLRERVSDDVEAFDIGKHPQTGEWRVWHEDYPDEGSQRLVPTATTSPASPPGDATPEEGRSALDAWARRAAKGDTK